MSLQQSVAASAERTQCGRQLILGNIVSSLSMWSPRLVTEFTNWIWPDGSVSSVTDTFLELLTCTEPDQLCLVSVHLQPISGHPLTDVVNALHRTLNSGWYVCSWHRDAHLRVISITVGSETTTDDDIKQFCGVQNKRAGIRRQHPESCISSECCCIYNALK